jgi:hypothetical protein
MSVRLTDYSGGTVTDSHRVPSANPHQFRGIMGKNAAGVNGFCCWRDPGRVLTWMDRIFRIEKIFHAKARPAFSFYLRG